MSQTAVVNVKYVVGEGLLQTCMVLYKLACKSFLP